MRLKNRMVMSPMTTAYCNDDQTPSERLIGHFEERAKGGVGLITLELVTIDEVHRYLHRSMTLGADKYIDHHRRITDAIHQHGCKVQPQISHTGPESVAPMFGDPYFPAKVATGKANTIRRCISCENCIDSMQMHDDLRCAINPLSGREQELKFTSTGKKVVVVGGGTGGLEAARLAAEAGHRVLLLERQRRLGGSLQLAATVHSDNEFFLQWLLAEVKRLPIEVRTGVEATIQLIKSEQADAVIVATGAVLVAPDISGVENSHVLTGALMRQIASGRVDDSEAHRLPAWLRALVNNAVPAMQKTMTAGLMRKASRYWLPLGKEVVIVGADLAAIELAEFLALRSRRVHVLDSGIKIAPEVGKKRRQEHMDRLDKLKVTVNTCVEFIRIEEGAVLIRTANGTRSIHGDNIIVAGTPVQDTQLLDALKQEGINAYGVGDCTGPGLIAKATHSAAEAVSKL